MASPQAHVELQPGRSSSVDQDGYAQHHSPQPQLDGPPTTEPYPDDYQQGDPQQNLDAAGNPRNEMIGQMVGGRNESLRRLKKGCQIIINLIEIILICVFLPLHWSRSCDTDLRVFLISRAIIDGFHIAIHIWTIKKPLLGLARSSRSLLCLIEYGFVLFALIELPETNDCNGSTVGLSIAMVVMTFLPIVLPLILLLLICCCLPCLLRCLVRWVELQDQAEGATEEDLDSLEELKWTPTLFAQKGAAQADECIICMIDYSQDDTVTILRCHHGLHTECLKTWLKLNKTCPMCRQSPFGDEPAQTHEIASSTTTPTAATTPASSTSAQPQPDTQPGHVHIDMTLPKDY